MEVLLTILARRNSKGLPGKNVRIMHGKPLIEWTIEQAQEWAFEHGDAVIAVSSDDEQVKKIALKHNLWFVQRPAELATDSAGKIPAIRHAWRRAEDATRKAFDVVIDLDVTNPLRRTEDIEAVYQQMVKENPPTIFSVTRARRNPHFNMWPLLGGGPLRRQDCPEMYDLNCNIYCYSRAFLLSEKQHVICHNSLEYIMPDWTAFDIDTETDFYIVEMLMEKYAKELGQA
jgi:CMP-N-acetylneuraminic acid synthetase